ACSDQPTIPSEATAPPGMNPSAGTAINESANPLDIAVIGDTPYGGAAIALFPALVKAIDGDPKVREVVHVGDFKSGSEQCSHARFQTAANLFATFKDPMIYAIGDNEWTDCHRANNGGYNPLDRLAKLREIFFSNPGFTLGAKRHVDAQDNYPENVSWKASRVV